MVFIIWESIVNPPPYSVLKIMIYKIIIEPVVLYGCEVPLCMLGNKILRNEECFLFLVFDEV
jgi:hypothetical protein